MSRGSRKGGGGAQPRGRTCDQVALGEGLVGEGLEIEVVQQLLKVLLLKVQVRGVVGCRKRGWISPANYSRLNLATRAMHSAGAQRPRCKQQQQQHDRPGSFLFGFMNRWQAGFGLFFCLTTALQGGKRAGGVWLKQTASLPLLQV